jgi:DNA-binding response OmpR family regulator
MAERLLMIEDDHRLAEMLSRYLGENGFSVTAKHDAASGLRAAAEPGAGYSAVILDVMLPDLDGFEVCRRIRTHSQVPILMLTARGDPTDRVVGLELGADDYLPKPFEPRELVARLRAILRRSQPSFGSAHANRTPPLRFGRLEIDREAHVARLDGRACDLTAHQFELLRVLAENAGRVMSRDAIMDRLSGGAVSAFDRSIDVHVSRIRAAIEDDAKSPRRILTVRGTGYLFVRNPEEPS